MPIPCKFHAECGISMEWTHGIGIFRRYPAFSTTSELGHMLQWPVQHSPQCLTWHPVTITPSHIAQHLMTTIAMTRTRSHASNTVISPPKSRSGRKRAISEASDRSAKKRGAKKLRQDEGEEGSGSRSKRSRCVAVFS